VGVPAGDRNLAKSFRRLDENHCFFCEKCTKDIDHCFICEKFKKEINHSAKQNRVQIVCLFDFQSCYVTPVQRYRRSPRLTEELSGFFVTSW
jgi:hypothetical protein